MKKVLAIVLAALLIVAALAGCAAKRETADTTATTDTAAAGTTDGKLVLEDPEYCASVAFTVGSWIEMLTKYSAG